MKTVIGEYGKAILAVILSAVLMLLAVASYTNWGRGRTAVDAGAAYEDRTVLQQIYTRAKPTIRFLTEEVLAIGEAKPLESFFAALDADGAKLTVEVLRIEDEKGTVCIYPFMQPGIYQVQVQAKDSWNRKTRQTFCVPVNRSRREI